MASSTVSWRGHEIPVPPLDPADPEVHFRQEFFRLAFSYVQYNEITGDYAEFGCASAKTFRLAWNQIVGRNLDCKLWAFDSFAGLPEQLDERDYHPKWTTGNYPTPEDLFRLIIQDHGISEDAYVTVPGFYRDTIGPLAAPMRGMCENIALAYIDCDMYSSAADVFHFLSSRMKHGMVIGLDDYFCYSETAISGERLAMLHFLETNPQWTFVPFFSFNWHGQAFIVESKAYLRSAPEKRGRRLGRLSSLLALRMLRPSRLP
jgi:O-methyltransferase